jgi:hypothetical protein
MIASLIARLRPPPVTTVAALQQFLVERANLVCQKTIIGYCHARTLLPMNELMRDAVFAEAFRQARCRGYAAVLEDLVMVAEARLRRAADAAGAPLGEALSGVFARGLAAAADCGGDLDRAVLIDQVGRRLAEARQRAPRPIAEIAEVSAARIYAAMPIHERLRAPDKQAIQASVRFMLVGLGSDFDRRLAPDTIVADLAVEQRSP